MREPVDHADDDDEDDGEDDLPLGAHELEEALGGREVFLRVARIVGYRWFLAWRGLSGWCGGLGALWWALLLSGGGGRNLHFLSLGSGSSWLVNQG